MNIKLLLLEDEAALAEIVSESLGTKGFSVEIAGTIARARSVCVSFRPDIMVVDVMLPDGTGFDFVSEIRGKGQSVPVIFLTSRSRVEDVVKGFESGGNDYLKKPFSMAELIVRLQALLRPNKAIPVSLADEPYEAILGQFVFGYPSGVLSWAGETVTLSPREADLLHILVKNRNTLVDRDEILRSLWGNTDYFSGRSLDVFISKLRKYLKADRSLSIINVRGRGYRLV